MSLKKNVIILSTALALTGTTALPVFQGSASASQIETNQVKTGDQQAPLSEDKEKLVNKYDQYVEMESNGFFKLRDIDANNSGNQVELEQINKLINDSNQNLEKIYSNASQSGSQNQVATDDNSVIVSQTEKNEHRIQARSLFNEGSTFVKQQWWGYTVGISRSDIRQMGSYVGTGGTLTGAGLGVSNLLLTIPTPVTTIVGAIAGALTIIGFAWSNAPCGIVFNMSGTMVWGALPQ